MIEIRLRRMNQRTYYFTNSPTRFFLLNPTVTFLAIALSRSKSRSALALLVATYLADIEV